MRRNGVILIVSFLVSCNSNQNALRTIEFYPSWDSVTVLSNPDKGRYHHLLDNGISKYRIYYETL